MKTITITTCTVVGSDVTIVGTIADTTFTQPAQQVTVENLPALNTAWARAARLTSASLQALRFGANSVALDLLTWMSVVCPTLEPTLTWAPTITTQPSAAAAAGNASATGTLTSDNTNVADGETVVIGSTTYTFKTALTPTAGQVLIGANADASLLNLIRAINHTGTAGTDYANLGVTSVANTQVSAASSVTAHAFAVTALAAGLAGNAIASTETSAHLSWGAATLTGGTDSATTFTTAAASEFTKTYQWQYSADGSTGWTNCSGTVNGCAYTNGTTAVLTCTPSTRGQTGYYHRCNVTNIAGTTATSSAILTIT